MTVQHEVMEGEWLSQIARCYGANLSAVQNANPEITDPEATLSPPLTLTIPDIGSDERVHGPPCLAYYTVEAGDTWESIASRHFVDVLVLKDANRDVTLASGARLRVPLSSPGHNPYPPGYDSATAQRIEITAGSTLVLAGIVPPSSRVWYVVTLPETHIFKLKLTGAPDALALAVYNTYGEPHNPFGEPLDWTGFIPVTGDYYIKVTEVGGAAPQPYTLEVNLSLAPSPTAVPSATSQP
jgi:LysM repeat protein